MTLRPFVQADTLHVLVLVRTDNRLTAMHCPFCGANDTRVTDSRLVAEGDQVRRRRQCANCHERFTTYETAELIMPRVVKSDGSRESFNEAKLRDGMLRALEKRPVSAEAIEASVERIQQTLRARGDREVNAREIGEAAMKASVAYRNVPLDPKYRRKMVSVFTRRLLGQLPVRQACQSHPRPSRCSLPLEVFDQSKKGRLYLETLRVSERLLSEVHLLPEWRAPRQKPRGRSVVPVEECHCP